VLSAALCHGPQPRGHQHWRGIARAHNAPGVRGVLCCAVLCRAVPCARCRRATPRLRCAAEVGVGWTPAPVCASMPSGLTHACLGQRHAQAPSLRTQPAASADKQRPVAEARRLPRPSARDPLRHRPGRWRQGRGSRAREVLVFAAASGAAASVPPRLPCWAAEPRCRACRPPAFASTTWRRC